MVHVLYMFFAHACIHNYIFLFSFANSKEIKRQTLIDQDNWLCSMHRACRAVTILDRAECSEFYYEMKDHGQRQPK